MTTENSRVDALTDGQLCAIQYAMYSLRAIAERRELTGDVIRPLNDIRTASRRAAAALKRFEPVANALLAVSSVEQHAVSPWRGACEHTTANIACRICREEHGDDYDGRDAPASADDRAAQPFGVWFSARLDEGSLDVHDRKCAEFVYESLMNGRVAASTVARAGAASIYEFNGDTNTLIRSIMTLLEMDAAGALGEHGVGDHARNLLGAAAARLAAVPPHEPGPKQPSRLITQSAAPAHERAATCEAIDGAVAFGYQNTNVPPSDDHWLAKYWHMGQKLAQLDALPASARYPAAWVRFRSDGGFEGPIMDGDERMCDVRRKSGAWSPLFLGPAQATEPVAYRLLRRNIVSKEWVSDSRDWVDGAPSADLIAEAAERSSEWCVQVAFAGPLPAAMAPFQQRVRPWMLVCFGAEISVDVSERNHRFFEEAGELVQSRGMTREEAHALVDYTWSRPVGEPAHEVGGVMVTLAALCLANGLDMHAAGERELARVNEPSTIERIRAKQATKPKHSPLPGVAPRIGSHGSDA